jgi:Zn-dependent protease with chaperone function
LRSRADRWAGRQAESLFRQASGAGAQRPGWGLARILSYALAICVHLFCVALVAVAIWLLVALGNVIAIIAAAVLLLLAFELRPRLGSFRKLRNVRYRKDAPALFGVLDQVAAAAGAKPAHAVVISARWNASYAAIGWGRRRVVTLGLPLWEALSAGQKIAVLGHEFAHGVNGDARHGAIVGTSIGTLARLQDVLRPGGRRVRGGRYRNTAGGAALAEQFLVRPLLALLSALVGAVLTLQQLISLRAGQRAEYRADVIAARIASPDGVAGMLDTMATGETTYSFTVGRRRFREPGTSFWDQLHAALEAVPENERERRRRVDARRPSLLSDTHPPTYLRVKMARGLPPAAPRVRLSPEGEKQIRAELDADYQRIGRWIDERTR